MGVVTDATIDSPNTGAMKVYFNMADASGDDIELFEAAMRGKFVIDIDIGLGQMRILVTGLRVIQRSNNPPMTSYGTIGMKLPFTRDLEVTGVVRP